MFLSKLVHLMLLGEFSKLLHLTRVKPCCQDTSRLRPFTMPLHVSCSTAIDQVALQRLSITPGRHRDPEQTISRN